ncbi:MAG: glutaredoxin domain-containing protein [Thermodesulfobacteriota bacterium]
MNRGRGRRIYFFILSLLGALYLLTEIGLQLSGRSVCVSEGCNLAVQFTRFGDLFMVGIGFLAVSGLAVLSGINLKRDLPEIDFLIHLILIPALAVEGFFTGYQLFWLPEICLFCISVFAVIFILGLVRLIAGWKEVLFGFAALAAVLGTMSLILPPPGKTLPLDKKMVLFYKNDCQHCQELKAEIEKKKLEVALIQVKEYSAALKNLGVDSVPTLLVNGRYEKLLLTGKSSIQRYLETCSSLENPVPKKSPAPVEKGAVVNPKGTESLPPPSTLFSPGQVFNPSREEEACKQEQKCD